MDRQESDSKKDAMSMDETETRFGDVAYQSELTGAQQTMPSGDFIGIGGGNEVPDEKLPYIGTHCDVASDWNENNDELAWASGKEKIAEGLVTEFLDDMFPQSHNTDDQDANSIVVDLPNGERGSEVDEYKQDDNKLMSGLTKEQLRNRRRRLRRIIKKCKGNPSFTRLLNVDLDISDDEQYFNKSYYEEEAAAADDENQYNITNDTTGRKRQREVKRYVNGSGRVLETSESQRQPPKKLLQRVRISIDAMLGLDGRQGATWKSTERLLKFSAAPSNTASNRRGSVASSIKSINEPFRSDDHNYRIPVPSSAVTPALATSHQTRTNTRYQHQQLQNAMPLSPLPVPLTPAEEGWYEGSVLMALPEDVTYLSHRPIHQWLRSNLEFFSASESDTALSQSGRRTPTVRGKVGIRCIHCTAHAAAVAKSGMGAPSGRSDMLKLWPPGSVSYPLSIGGIYASVAQKTQQHFLGNCPTLPASLRAQMLYLLQDSAPASTSSNPLGGSAQPKLSAMLYYSISAKRFGLVDVDNGIRFGRDVSLDPFPFENIRAQVEADQQQQGYPLPPAGMTSPATPSKLVTYASEIQTDIPVIPTLSNPAVATSMEVRATVDPEFESVLAQSVAEADDPEKYVGRSSDKVLVSDYMFLIVRQMHFCRAVSYDFTSRGKKPRLMRIGFAGFNCRWCQQEADKILYEHLIKTQDRHADIPGDSSTIDSVLANYHAYLETSCRSFPSASENLSSSISNSFWNHLQRCENLPKRIKKALLAYKRIHPRQISQLVYGSQRRLILDIWSRLRGADRSKEESSHIIARRIVGRYVDIDLEKGAMITADNFEAEDEVDNEDDNMSSSQRSTDVPSSIDRKQELETDSQEPVDLSELGFFVISSANESESVSICRNCRMVPVQFRARHAIVFEKKSIEDAAQAHYSKCTKNCINLETVADGMERILKTYHQGNVDVMDTESFKALIHAAVGGSTSFVRILTEVLKLFIQKRRQKTTATRSSSASQCSPEIWRQSYFCEQINYESVQDAFADFAKGNRGVLLYDVSGNLQKHSLWIDYLMLISPFLQIP